MDPGLALAVPQDSDSIDVNHNYLQPSQTNTQTDGRTDAGKLFTEKNDRPNAIIAALLLATAPFMLTTLTQQDVIASAGPWYCGVDRGMPADSAKRRT